MRTRFMLAAAAVCAGLFLLTCSKSDSPSGPDTGVVNATWTYTVEGSNIIVSHPADTSTSCNDSILETDITPAYTDTSWYILNGDTLLVEDHDNPGTPLTMVRIGTGTGLQGQWSMNMYGLDVTVTVDATTITSTTCFADMYMLVIGQALDSLTNISPNRISCSSVQLVGNTSGEIVTITFSQVGNNPENMDADLTYSSNNPLNAPGTEYANPTSCPNEGPDWLTWFYLANLSHPAAKHAVPPVCPLTPSLKITLFR